MSNFERRDRLLELIEWTQSTLMKESPEMLATNFKDSAHAGIIGITSLLPQIKQMQEILPLIHYEKIERLPQFKRTEVIELLEKMVESLDHLHTFRSSSSKALIEEMTNQLTSYFNGQPNTTKFGNHGEDMEKLWPIIADSITLDMEANQASLVSELKSKVSDVKTLHDEFKKAVDAGKADIQKETVAKHARIFHDQAVTHSKAAKNWRAASIVLILVDFGVIILSFCLSLYFKLPEEKISLAIFGALVISLISFSIVLCVRNYFSERHNEAINRHKANCLSSYETFVSTATGSVKDAILTYTTQTIFAPFNPGYLNKDGMQSPLPIVEVIRAAQPEKRA